MSGALKIRMYIDADDIVVNKQGFAIAIKNGKRIPLSCQEADIVISDDGSRPYRDVIVPIDGWLQNLLEMDIIEFEAFCGDAPGEDGERSITKKKEPEERSIVKKKLAEPESVADKPVESMRSTDFFEPDRRTLQEYCIDPSAPDAKKFFLGATYDQLIRRRRDIIVFGGSKLVDVIYSNRVRAIGADTEPGKDPYIPGSLETFRTGSQNSQVDELAGAGIIPTPAVIHDAGEAFPKVYENYAVTDRDTTIEEKAAKFMDNFPHAKRKAS